MLLKTEQLSNCKSRPENKTNDGSCWFFIHQDKSCMPNASAFGPK